MAPIPKPSRRPPLAVLALLAVPLAALAWLQLGDGFGDEGMNNAVSYGAVLGALAILGLWLLLRRGATRRTRLALVLGTLAAVAATAAVVRIDGWSGALVPHLRFVWQASRGPGLEGGRSVTRSDVDLATTTPEDFPGFLGPTRTAYVPGPALARDWSASPPVELWRVPVGYGWSGFAVVNGVAVTQEQRGSEELVVARDVETGAELWRDAHRAPFDHSLGGKGPRATPAIAHGLVYAQGVRGRLACLDGRDGSVVWERDLRREYGMTDELEAKLVQYGRSCSPLVYDDVVVVPVGGDPAGKRAGLAAFDRRTGELVFEGPPRNISHASPNIATLAGVRQLLVTNEDTVSGHDPASGRLLWEHPWPGTTNADANNSQPLPIAPDRVLISKGYGVGSSLLRLAPGAEGGDGALSVEVLWASRRALRTKFTNAAVRDGHAYALSDGILECVALADGERVWRDGRYGHGQILLVGDLLLVLSDEGELLLVEATPERANSVLGRLDALEGQTWNTIALYGDVVLVRNGREATALRLPLAGG